MLFVRFKQPYEAVEHPFGVAFWDVKYMRYVCVPIPFNFVVRAIRRVYYRMMYPRVLIRKDFRAN